LRTAPGHDINYQSLAGVFGLTTGDTPFIGAYPRIPLADLAMTAYAVIAVLAGLRSRDATGVGCYIDLAAADSLVSFAGPYIQALGKGHPLTKELPHYGTFEAGDGKWLSIGIVYEQHFWKNLVTVLDLPPGWTDLEIDDRQRMTVEIRDAIQARINSKDCEAWVTELTAGSVPAMALRNPSQVLQEDYFVERGVVRSNGDTRFIGMPFRVQPLDK